MERYHKKPVWVDAIQINDENREAILRLIGSREIVGVLTTVNNPDGSHSIHEVKVQVDDAYWGDNIWEVADPGDWLVLDRYGKVHIWSETGFAREFEKDDGF